MERTLVATPRHKSPDSGGTNAILKLFTSMDKSSGLLRPFLTSFSAFPPSSLY
jgi:hypothetical protein